MMNQSLVPLNFSTRKEAMNFTRDLTKDTRNMRIKAQGLAVYVPESLYARARELYSAQCRRLANQSVNIGAFAAGILQLLSDSQVDISEDHPVIEALRRSADQLDDASVEEIRAYLSEMPPESLAGVINNAKGIYHEQLFVAAENADGDVWQATIMPETNHPGSDVVLENSVTGETIEVQLKATDSAAYVSEHFERYPDIPVMTTEELAGQIEDVESTGISHADVTSEVSEGVGALSVSGEEMAGELVSDVFTGGIIGVLISETIQAANAINENRSPEFDKDRIAKAAKRAMGLALVTGIIW